MLFVLCTFAKMYQLNLPDFEFKFRKGKAYPEIFDEIRKRYVKITPEEWVRQHWVKTLVKHYACPPGRIAIEKALVYNNTNRRTDIVVFDAYLKPLLIVELKAPEVKLSEMSLEQIGIYNASLKVPWLLLSNGMQHFVFKVDFEKQKTHLVEELPNYTEMIQP